MKLPSTLERPVSRLRTEWYRISKHRRRLVLHTTILFAIGIIFSLITLNNPWANFQWNLSDRLYLSEELPKNQDVLLAAIDEETLSHYYDKGYESLTEWPRSLHEQAITNLSQAGALVIGFDVLFVAPDKEDGDLVVAMQNAGNVLQPVLGVDPEGGNVFGNFLETWPKSGMV